MYVALGDGAAVAVIDPTSDAVVARIDLGPDVGPAHGVVSADGATALLRIDAKTHAVIDRTSLGAGDGANGATISPDGSTAWIADGDGRCVDFVSSANGTCDRVMTSRRRARER